MKFQNELEKGVYTTLEQLLQSQWTYGTDDYNEYVLNVIQPLIMMDILPLKWRTVFESYKEYSQDEFDYGELGDWLLEGIKKDYKKI